MQPCIRYLNPKNFKANKQQQHNIYITQNTQNTTQATKTQQATTTKTQHNTHTTNTHTHTTNKGKKNCKKHERKNGHIIFSKSFLDWGRHLWIPLPPSAKENAHNPFQKKNHTIIFYACAHPKKILITQSTHTHTHKQTNNRTYTYTHIHIHIHTTMRKKNTHTHRTKLTHTRGGEGTYIGQSLITIKNGKEKKKKKDEEEENFQISTNKRTNEK